MRAFLADLLDAGVHLGHKTYHWNPKMFSFIYTEIDGVHILDLVQTAQLLKYASLFVILSASKKKTFLFIGTKRQAKKLISEEAKRCCSFYVNNRWLGGMLTNWLTVKNRIARLNTLEHQKIRGFFNTLPTKEYSAKQKELAKLKKLLTGLKNMKTLPDIAIIVDQKYEINAVQECRKLGIPIISIIDTNCDPDLVDIGIPGNDDSVSSIKFILRVLSDSVLIGRYLSLKKKKKRFTLKKIGSSVS